ncbi:hypothetical protein CVT25_001757 [Psilocybe cyanescens]|uniref:Uncharacterized protein n=1 Tax=Psilocybe cyanescens TaxID=93625 RepID=A0A409WPR5_PSICY|nr:hypothetical protein CVT25_001757 [Psilocybe cyanescens]
MTKANTWPDWATYKPLTREMGLAAQAAQKPRLPVGFVGMSAQTEDYADDDTYVSSPLDSTPPPPTQFTVPHLYASVEATGPAISDFPLSFKALLDIGCPSTVISGSMATSLGLRRFPLPAEEDNLSSLTDGPLVCREYAKLVLTSGNGAWVSKTIYAKICDALPVSIILGMPFLSSEQFVIDPEDRTAIQKHTKYDLLNPNIPERVWQPEYTIPPPTPPKPKRPPRIPFEQVPAPSLDGSGLSQRTVAAVHSRIEAIAFKERITPTRGRRPQHYR